MTKISNLPADASPTTTDIVPTVDVETSTTKKVTLANILSLFFDNIPSDKVTNASLKTGVDEPGGAWNTYVPSFTNVSGGTLNYAKTKKVGKTRYVRLKYTMAGANVSGAITFTLPSNFSTDLSNPDTLLCKVLLRDSSPASEVQGGLRITGTGSVILYSIGGTPAASTTTSSTSPFTWASGDYFQVYIVYDED